MHEFYAKISYNTLMDENKPDNTNVSPPAAVPPSEPETSPTPAQDPVAPEPIADPTPF